MKSLSKWHKFEGLYDLINRGTDLSFSRMFWMCQSVLFSLSASREWIRVKSAIVLKLEKLWKRCCMKHLCFLFHFSSQPPFYADRFSDKHKTLQRRRFRCLKCWLDLPFHVNYYGVSQSTNKREQAWGTTLARDAEEWSKRRSDERFGLVWSMRSY